MVYFDTSEEWQRQSSLLLQARPTTVRLHTILAAGAAHEANISTQTRITTKYKIPNLSDPKYQNSRKRKLNAEADEKETSAPKVARAFIVLKTYDPESGVVLKFKTDRHAEVGRLVTGLGRLGRHMAALPESAAGIARPRVAQRSLLTSVGQGMEDVTSPDANAKTAALPPKDAGKDLDTPATKDTPQPPSTTGSGGGGGGGKKKKKGKK